MDRSESNGAHGCDSTILTVDASTAVTSLMAKLRKLMEPVLLVRARFKDHATSWAVMGVPSLKVTFVLRASVYVMPSLLISCESTSHGCSAPLASVM